jgi:hypothetical protein
MNDLILRNYETFDEIPEGYLMVKENSNLMYVRIGNSAFIAREFINSIKVSNEFAKYIVSYYEVRKNEKILTLEIDSSLSNYELKKINKREDVDIIPLSKVLNIVGNDVSFVSLEDVETITNFKGEYSSGKKMSII